MTADQDLQAESGEPWEPTFSEAGDTHAVPPCTADPDCTADEHLLCCPAAPHSDPPPTLSTPATSTEEHP